MQTHWNIFNIQLTSYSNAQISAQPRYYANTNGARMEHPIATRYSKILYK